MRAELPTGTVTFLFTDIEGSTRLLHELGAKAYRDALAEHRRVLRHAFAAHGGVEVDTQGDAFFVAFPTAAGAVAAAHAGTESLDAGPIRVRMGLHTGTPTSTDEGYVGVDVHRGARVAALAHGGQIVVSPPTAALLEGEPVRDLGLHRLKDFDGATRLFQLGARDFPALRTPGSVQLPTPATRFLGREQELFDAVSIVVERDPRVLTVVGPGGTGKTRFAIELARLLAEEADGGTVFVPLAPLRDAGLVLTALAETLGASMPDTEAIATRVGDARTHVVVDNVEHLLPDAAVALAALVETAPALRLLVTSREPLRIGGEIELDLPPLAEPEAIAFFVERARAVRPDVEATASVAELCERLDRLPLALELAAARTKLLAPDALLARLADRLDALKGTRDADERHSTLRATIAWSHDLLDDAERQLFARLSVFRGGCTLEAVEEVCGAGVDTLGSLLDKSLVRRRTDSAGEERFWMLETIREFASERLETSGEIDDVRRRHAERVLAIARDAHEGFSEKPDFERVHDDLEEIRAALDWAHSHDPALAAEIFVSLEQLWVTSLIGEGRDRVEALLEIAAELTPHLRAKALKASGGIVILHGDVELGEQRYSEALEIFRELGDEYNVAGLLARFAVHAGFRGDREEAERLVAEVRELNEAAQHPMVEPQMLSTLGDLAYRAEEWDRARELYGRSIEAARSRRFVLWELWQSTALLEVELRLDRLADAERTGCSALLLARRLQDRDISLWVLSCLALAAFRQGDAQRAGVLWGAVSEEEREQPPVRSWEELVELRKPLTESTDAGFLAAVEEGGLSTLEQAVAIALGEDGTAQTVP
jgi:predicted ATPase/class 3 adenylate cyclase